MDNSKYLDVFIDESTEHIETMYQQLLLLEKTPEDKSIIEEIFRAAHTIKGMSATMGFDDLSNLTHKIENVFDSIRYDRVSVHTTLVDSLFNAVDYMNAMVEDIAKGGSGKENIQAIVEQLERAEKGLDIQGSSTDAPQKITTSSTSAFQLDQFQITILNESKERGYDNYEITIQLNEDCLLKAARVYMVFELLEKHGEVVISNPAVNELEEENFDNSFSVMFVTKHDEEEIRAKIMKVSEIESVTITPFSVDKYIQDQSQNKDHDEPSSKGSKVENKVSISSAPSKTIRVNMERLDTLMNLFEELVIDRGRLEQISIDLNHSELQDTVEKMSRVSSDLQHIILQMRMVPIDTVFSRFPRMIRQLAKDLQKEIELEIIGSETELDRTVIDEIGDPLVHLIRNAIDHGLENPAERIKQGKPEQGKVTLEAYHSGNHVFIEISDDGAGINEEKVRKKAIEKWIITEAYA